jgi:hypothetical protein
MSEAACLDSQSCAEDGECHLEVEEQRCDKGLERNSTGMMWGGIGVVLLGGVTTLAGVVLGLTSICFDNCDAGSNERGDAALPTIGVGLGLAVVVGTPLAIAGGAKVPRSRRAHGLVPTVRIGGASVSLDWSF